MASHGITDSISQLFGDGFACLLKRRLDKRNPMFLGYLLHENHLTETIERTIGIVEDIEHQYPYVSESYGVAELHTDRDAQGDSPW